MNPFLQHQTFHIVEARFRMLKQYRLPRPFQDSSMGPFETFGIATIWLRDADGTEGEAPAAQPDYLESIILPRLLRDAPISYAELYHELYWASRNAGFRGPAGATVGWVDLALHDLAARRAGKPLHRFLGANRDWAAAYGSGGGTNLTERELVEEMTGLVEQGFTSLKMKVGKNFGRCMDEDVRRVRAVRKAVGPKPRLAVDANQTWTAEAAVEFAGHIEDQDISWFEEPVHSADLVAIGKLCRSSPIPVAMGESEMCGKVFPALADAGVGHFQPAIHQVAGVNEWLATRDLAKEKRLAFSSGGYSQLSAQLVATAAQEAETEILVPIVATLDPFLALKAELKRGRFLIPSEPGLCLRVAWERLAREGMVALDKHWTRADVASVRTRVQ